MPRHGARRRTVRGASAPPVAGAGASAAPARVAPRACAARPAGAAGRLRMLLAPHTQRCVAPRARSRARGCLTRGCGGKEVAVKMPRQRVGAPPAASGGAPAPKRTPQAARRWVAARVTGRAPRAGRPPRRRDAETCVAAGSVVADAFLSCSWSIAAAPATTRRAAVGSCSPPRAPQTRLRKPSEPQPERLRPSLR